MKIAGKILALILAAALMLGTVVSAVGVTTDTDIESASISGYVINAIMSNNSNANSYYTYKAAGNDSYKSYATYIKDEKTGRNEITSGCYVDITLQITDAVYASLVADDSKVSITTTGGSAFQATSCTTGANGCDLTRTGSTGYTLTLPGLGYNGTSTTLELLITSGSYNVKISTSIKNAAVTPVDTSTDKDKTTDSAKPYVIISSYSYGRGDLVAGETRNVTMTFSNTSKSIAVENMMVTMNLPADAMVLTSSSNTFYIERLEAGKSITKTVNVTVKPTAAAQSQAMAVNFTYDYLDNGTRKSASTDESISMPIVQVDRFTVTGIEMQDTLFQGEESNLTVNFVNKGRSDVYNISTKLSCAGLTNDGEEQYIGNLASGTTSSADFYITAQTPGEISGEIIISYEDTNMQECTVKVPFTGNVMSYEDVYGPMDPGMEDPGMMEPEQPQQSFPWYWIVLGVFVIGGGVFYYLKKRKSNKENVDEDEDF